MCCAVVSVCVYVFVGVFASFARLCTSMYMRRHGGRKGVSWYLCVCVCLYVYFGTLNARKNKPQKRKRTYGVLSSRCNSISLRVHNPFHTHMHTRTRTHTRTHAHTRTHVYCQVDYTNPFGAGFETSISYALQQRGFDVTVNVSAQTIHCNTLQYTATHCNTLQHTATHCCANNSVCIYRVAWSHRMPYFHRSFSAKEPYN